jgi:hypothetical protein
MKLLRVLSALTLLTLALNVFANEGIFTEYDKCVYDAEVKADAMTHDARQKLNFGIQECQKESNESTLADCLQTKQSIFERDIKDIKHLRHTLNWTCLKTYGSHSNL